MSFSNSPKENITAEVVNKKIEEYLKPDGKLTDAEKKEINRLYKLVKTKEGKNKVKAYINQKLSGKTKKELLNLMNNVEKIDGDFSMETLSKNSKSRFFNIILKNEAYRDAYSEFLVGNLIKENKEYFPEGHKTLNLVFWKKIVDDIGFKSAGGMMADKVAGFFNGIVKKVSSVGEKVEKKEKFSISELGDIIDSLRKIGDNPTEENQKKLPGLIGKLKGYIYYILKDYTKNLNTLIELGKKDKEGLKKLLDNPIVLDSVLKTGKYNENGYDIDLKNKKVKFASNSDLKKSKEEFMKLAIKATNKNGEKFDALKSKVKEITGALKKFGLDPNELREFRDSLKKIPIIGPFLFALVSFFLSDKVLNLMEGKIWEKEYKIAGKNFEKVVKDNSDKLPFVVDKKDFEDTEVSGAVEAFLATIDSKDKQNFENIQYNKEQEFKTKNPGKEYKKETYKKLIEQKDFWKDIFGEEEPTDPILKQVYISVKNIKEKNKGKNLSAKEFFQELNKNLKIEITSKIEKQEGSGVVDKQKKGSEEKKEQVKSSQKNKLTLQDKQLLEKEIIKIEKIPATIKIKDKAGIEKDLNIDFKEGKLLVNGEEFVLKNGKITDIKIDKNEVIFKVDNNGKIEEKKLTKQEFAQIIGGLAIASPIAIKSLDFVIVGEKQKILALTQKEQAEKKQDELQQKVKTLEEEGKNLDTEISKIKTELEGEKGLNVEVKVLQEKIQQKQQEINNFKSKKRDTLEQLKEKNDKLVELKEELSNTNWYEFLDKPKLEGQIQILKTEILALKNKNKTIDNDILKAQKELDTYQKLLSEKLNLQKEKQNKLTNLLKQKETTQQEILRLKKELGASIKEIKKLEEEMNKKVESKKENETDKKDQLKKKDIKVIPNTTKTEQKEVNTQPQAKEMVKKSFENLLQNPTKIEDERLVLEDGTEIKFNSGDASLEFGGNKYGVKGFQKTIVLNMLKKHPFSFKEIFNSDKKQDFIEVLADLKNKGKASYSGISFEKLS